MPTQHQPWLRAELIAAPETMPGAQLMIPADGVEFHDDELVFHHQGDIVYVAARDQLRSITWFAKQPNPETARRRAQWPKHGTRWTDEERADLLRRIRAGESWKAISLAHARSRTGCQQEAVKQGWVQPDTFRPTPELLLGIAEMEAGRDSAPVVGAAATNEPGLSAARSAPPPEGEPATRLSEAAPHTELAARPSSAVSPAESSPVTEPAFAATKTAPPHTETAIRPSPAVPPTEPAFASAKPAAPRTERAAQPPTAVPPTDSTSPIEPAFAAPESVPRAESAAPPTPAISPAPASVAADIAAPNPDRPDCPQIPPRVPRQRTDSGPPPAPKSEGEGDSEKDSDPGPGSGSRLFSRAQSSLARATLGAYMNPSRSQSGTAPGST